MAHTDLGLCAENCDPSCRSQAHALNIVDIVIAVNFHKRNRQQYMADERAFAPALNHAMYLHLVEHNLEDALYVVAA